MSPEIFSYFVAQQVTELAAERLKKAMRVRNLKASSCYFASHFSTKRLFRVVRTLHK